MILREMIHQVENTRINFIAACSGLTLEESTYKESADTWSIANIAEHIVRAEWGGINGIWQAIEGFRNGKPLWTGQNPNHGLSIEDVVERTWLPIQPAPEVARPQWGGPIEFWLICLGNCKITLAATEKQMEGLDPEEVIYPHPISGPLNVKQRMEFLRFHMERHIQQIERVKQSFRSK